VFGKVVAACCVFITLELIFATHETMH